MNKYLIKSVLVVAALVLLTACKSFDELNTNPTKSSTIDPNSQLSYAQLMTWGDWMTVQTYTYYCAPFTQLMQGDWATTQYGGEYRRNNEYMNAPWDRIYSISIKNLVDVVHRTEGEARYNNVRQISRIMLVYYFTILTDLYGDIPYTEAGLGFINGIKDPVYNTQKFIYHDMLRELKEAAAALDAQGTAARGDIIYKGNVAKWQKMANSMRLRLAMRLTKVEPETARTEITDLLGNGYGLIEDAADDATIDYMDLNDWAVDEPRRNALAQQWYGRETFPTSYVCSTLWNKLRETNDPRTLRIARCYSEVGYTSIPYGRVDLSEEILTQVGWHQFQPVRPGAFWYTYWPTGYQSTLTKTWEMKACIPALNNAFYKGNTPGILMTSAEVELLLAEAKARWTELPDGGVTPEAHFTAGVKAAMKLLTRYGIDPVTETETADYFAANKFPGDLPSQLKVINEQLWILHLTNLPEAYANWRRSGYPVLKPSSEYGAVTIDSRTIPRRLNYPPNEASYNNASYQQAIAVMGGVDSWNARVWWDAE